MSILKVLKSIFILLSYMICRLYSELGMIVLKVWLQNSPFYIHIVLSLKFFQLFVYSMLFVLKFKISWRFLVWTWDSFVDFNLHCWLFNFAIKILNSRIYKSFTLPQRRYQLSCWCIRLHFIVHAREASVRLASQVMISISEMNSKFSIVSE